MILASFLLTWYVSPFTWDLFYISQLSFITISVEVFLEKDLKAFEQLVSRAVELKFETERIWIYNLYLGLEVSLDWTELGSAEREVYIEIAWQVFKIDGELLYLVALSRSGGGRPVQEVLHGNQHEHRSVCRQRNCRSVWRTVILRRTNTSPAPSPTPHPKFSVCVWGRGAVALW